MYLLNQCPDRGITYQIVCCATSESTFAEEVRVERRGIPTLAQPIRAFYAAAGTTDLRDMALRARFDAEMLRRIEPYFPDVLLLDGYLYLVTEPLLAAFPSRAINLHFSDLTFRDARGGPLFPGVRAVRDTIAAGCHETRATVHLVNQAPDAGPPIVRSWPFVVSPLVEDLRATETPDAFKAYVYAHQQWMMRTASGPLLAAALRLVATGRADGGVAADASDVECPWTLARDHTLIAEADRVAY
jgi:folate-dependent phosphoribosylglycinamide formyltransferase PurN